MAASAALLIGACGWSVRLQSPRPGEDSKNVQYTFERLPNGRMIRSRVPLPSSLYRLRLAPGPKVARAWRVVDRIHPRLDSLIHTLPADTRVQVMITYRDPIRMPRFPRRPPPGMPWPASDSIVAVNRGDSLIAAIQARRDSVFARDSLDLHTVDPTSVVLRKYWLVQARLVEMQIGQVIGVLGNPDVTYIAPNSSGETPPTCSTASLDCSGSTQDCLCKTLNLTTPDTPQDGRGRIGATSGRWLEPGGTGPIAILDTGVRKSHVAFNTLTPGATPLHLRTLDDLVDHTMLGDGLSSNPDDLDDNAGHGTSTAAILTAVPCPSDKYRGVTDATLDSHNVYEPSGHPASGLNRDAVVRAFQRAIYSPTGTVLTPVVVAEMQALGSDHCEINDAADNAFDTGAIVIAAQGNASEVTGGMVASPARARRAIAVGAYSIMSTTSPPTPTEQCAGPSDEGRIKPDVMGPTNSWVAGNRDVLVGCTRNDDYGYHGFNATSGATPYVAGAAALLDREFGLLTPPATDPGNVYAGLILSGQSYWSGSAKGTATLDADRGAGAILLPSLSPKLWAGNVVVPATTLTADIPIDLTGMTGVKKLEAGVWWPDPVVESWTWEIRIVEFPEIVPGWSGLWPRILYVPHKILIPVLVPGTVTYEHSDVDIELIPPGSTSATASSLDASSVFERATSTVTASQMGTWTLRISGASLPAGDQTVYYAVTVR